MISKSMASSALAPLPGNSLAPGIWTKGDIRVLWWSLHIPTAWWLLNPNL